MNQQLLDDAKEAGMKAVYGCKLRNDRNADTCPCEEKDTGCELLELAYFKLPAENVEMLAKFAELIEAQQANTIEALRQELAVINDGLDADKALTKALKKVDEITIAQQAAHIERLRVALNLIANPRVIGLINEAQIYRNIAATALTKGDY